MYEELKKVTFKSGNSDGQLNVLKRENDQLKIQIAKLLKNEKRLDEELYGKDSHI